MRRSWRRVTWCFSIGCATWTRSIWTRRAPVARPLSPRRETWFGEFDVRCAEGVPPGMWSDVETRYGIWWGCNDNRSCCCLRIDKNCLLYPTKIYQIWDNDPEVRGIWAWVGTLMGRLTILQHQVVPGISWHAASLSEGATIFHRLF